MEDPVELQLKGINQVQLNLKAGLTFASALKSILRSDPDIVLVGEIRDKETAMIAIEAALTGHLVLATLHTNDAASTPMRLVEMGLEPFLVTSSISAVLAQRLARRLCVHCKEAYELTEAEILAAGWSPTRSRSWVLEPTFFRAVGCSACSNTGYRGRKALAELMPMTEEIERLIIEGGSADDIHRLAVRRAWSPCARADSARRSRARPPSRKCCGWWHESVSTNTRVEWSLRLAQALVVGGYATETEPVAAARPRPRPPASRSARC